MVRTMGCILFVLCGTAQAGTLYKCITERGAVSFQTDPCGPDQWTANARHFVPDPPTRPVQRQPARTAPRQVRSGSWTGTRVPIESSPSRCEVAKADRERTLAAAGLNRTYDLLSRLDANVREACK